ncbi:uncharacterized protein C8orf76-like isoform X2 [Phyllobates terribilis]|uniref:uncharacterized protein C8orf76-like isoform X2 n=1 Tax=Phyllobates terribilis TaxID=111132 RepID=UPI003CCB175E
MECDFCFEDSVFSETRERTSPRGLSYTARQCEPQWFNGDVNQDDLVEAHTMLKFRADLSYRREDYEAFNVYSDCSALIPLANNAMRRDVQESQARCLLRLGRHKEALESAELLAKGVNNTDHLTGVLHLQATIHNHLGNLQEEMSCLQQLISLHPFSPQLWICLAESSMRLFLSITDCEDPSHNSHRFSLCAQTSLGAPQQCIHDIARTDHPTVSRADHSVLGPCNRSDTSSRTASTHREQLWTCSCAGFIRARYIEDITCTEKPDKQSCSRSDRALRVLLLQLLQPQHASFVLERNMKTQEQIEEQLGKLGLLEEQKRLIVEIMGEDLLAERTEEGQMDTKTTQTLASYIMPSDTEFRVKWFQKATTFLMSSE